MLRSSSLFNQTQSPFKQLPPFNSDKHRSVPKNKINGKGIKKTIPAQLLFQVSFDPKKQKYFRTIQELPGKQRAVRLGWRIIQLSLQEIDLALFCLSMLQAQSNFPLKIFPANQEEEKRGNQIYKDIWVEVMVVQSKDKDTIDLELPVYELCVNHLLPSVRLFMGKYINWTYMKNPQYQDLKVIQKFKNEVIKPFQLKVQNFKPIQGLSS